MKPPRVTLNCPLRKLPYWWSIALGINFGAIALMASYVVIHFVVKYW